MSDGDITKRALGALKIGCDVCTPLLAFDNGAAIIYHQLYTDLLHAETCERYFEQHPEIKGLVDNYVSVVHNHPSWIAMPATPERRIAGLHILGCYMQFLLYPRFYKEEKRIPDENPLDHMRCWFEKNSGLDPKLDSDQVTAGFLAIFYV